MQKQYTYSGLFVFMMAILMLSSIGFAQDGDGWITKKLSGVRGVKTVDYFPVRAGQESLSRAVAAESRICDPYCEDSLFPFEDTFFLHSRPGATKVIYLDFDGHTYDDWVYDPWNFEGADTTFSDTERTIIQLAWHAIAEDFLPFDVDVTTEFPGIEALKNTGDDDTEWGVRAVINHNSYDYSWAYIGSFNDSEDVELYAWSGNDPSAYETWLWIADSVSHEAGHALGLEEQGTSRSTYYYGHGTGDVAWSPIMGWTNYGLSQWDKGEYTDANNLEDDLLIITTQNGFGYRLDDHGSTTAAATPVDIDLSFVAEGIIEQNTDIDYFAFTMAGDGYRIITIRPDYLNPNLDILAKIYDSGGTVVYESNPPRSLYAEFDILLTAGGYYLSIDGTGYDDPHSDGYSDYGCLGYYSIEAYEPKEGDIRSTSCGLGECVSAGEKTFSGGTWVGDTCVPGASGIEACNTLDDDCDGSTDEGFTIGPETCNGRDDDCDSRTDEGLGVSRCGRGPCRVIVENCVAGAPQTCVPGTPGTEICGDRIDQDCDGADLDCDDVDAATDEHTTSESDDNENTSGGGGGCFISSMRLYMDK